MNDAIRMQISAYVDGELPENEAELLLRRMSQDIELRREVAEFLAMSRLIRGATGLAASDRLHERVAAEIDQRPAIDEAAAESVVGSKALRPLIGIAVAASVALVAIVGLQQADVGVDAPIAPTQLPNATVAVPELQPEQEKQRQYFLNHADASSDLGANGMNSRLVALRFSEDVVGEEAEESTQQDNTEQSDTPLEAPAGPDQP